MKYYFFRDLDNEGNLSDGTTFHAAGYVEKLFAEPEKPSESGKDAAVYFINPFTGILEHAWRAFKEIELFEIPQYKYDYAVASYNLHFRTSQ